MAIENFAGMGPDGSPSNGPPIYAYTILFDYDVNGNLIYQGWALSSPKPGPDSEWPAQTSAIPAAGPATAGAYWAIKKLSYDGSNHLTTIQWANGNTQQVNSWDGRAGLSFQ